uniref:Poly [ADP-ribose] polymerase n=1 Tax=Sinocyclocheilus anshuiensis TaxID=1608454 RepID=A0A671LYU6_9TELE
FLSNTSGKTFLSDVHHTYFSFELHYEHIIFLSLEVIGKVSSPSLGVHTMQLGQVTLEVSSGDITKEKTDAIVNSSNQTFSLKAGVSKAILDAAGVQVVQECSQIGLYSFRFTSSGRLPCGNIIHVIGRNSPSEIKDVVLSVLKLCESSQITSVAFPALGTTAAQSPLPSHWKDMKGQAVVLVKLTAGSKEYAEVEKEFRRTNLNSKITEIERVQNNALWKNYMIKKEELEDKNKHKNNEKRLFHGTGPDKTDQINNHGFNRSFAGMHAMYGNGTYFAVDPSYSAQGYSAPDAKGHKRMYLVRVLVGDFTQGKRGLPVPPARSSNSADLYNSVTDNMRNPTMFVIFNDVQAYPEYLITFQ